MWFQHLFQRPNGLHAAHACAAAPVNPALPSTANASPRKRHPTPTRHTLQEEHGVQALHVAAGDPVVLTVQRGTLWLTQVGHAADHVLQAGQRLTLTEPACWMLGALNAETCMLDVHHVAHD